MTRDLTELDKLEKYLKKHGYEYGRIDDDGDLEEIANRHGLMRCIDQHQNVKTALMRAVINGTLLPKNHGRLVDADEVLKRAKQYIDHPVKYISQRNKDFIYYHECEEVVIEADKEVEYEGR